jgi:hypothetical protein
MDPVRPPLPPTHEPRELLRRELFKSLRGEAVDQGLLRRYRGEPALTGTGGRSGNWGWIAAAAGGDLNWAMAALEAEQHSGLGNREFGSLTYFADQLVARWRLLAIARAAAGERAATAYWTSAGEVAARLRSNLRAILGGAALAGLPSPAREMTLRRGAGPMVDAREIDFGGESKGDADGRFRGGLTVVLPSPRSNFDFADRPSALCSWALGVPGTRWDFPLDESKPATLASWPIGAAELVFGAHCGAPVAAASFGLEEDDREACAALWRDGGALDHVLGMLGPWFPAGLLGIYRTESGVCAWCEGAGWSAEKPTALFRSIDTEGREVWCMPQAWSKAGGQPGEAHLDPNAGTVDAWAPGGLWYANALPEGKPRYLVWWGRDCLSAQPELGSPPRAAQRP